MDIKTIDRKVCGDDNATDYLMERSLGLFEIENLAKELRGHVSAFGSLYYIDFEFGRLTIASNSLRCTYRTKIDNPDEKHKLKLYLKHLDKNINIEVVN